jgi:2-aminoadipate transaminase
MSSLTNVQLFVRDGMIEFGWGHPHPSLLPIAGIGQATEVALRDFGSSALAYGAEQGPGRLIDAICNHLAVIDGKAPTPQEIFITGGISQGIDLLCTLLFQPGDVVLVESPVYHLALRILRDHKLELVPVASDQEGLRSDLLAATIERLAAEGKRARMLYTVPSFTNPTGRTMSASRRAELMKLVEQHDLYVFEDDVYRELWFDQPPPPALASYGPAERVIRLCSFSKILSPGLRLGWIVADPAIVKRCMTSGMVDSGGGVNHLSAHIVAEFLHAGQLEPHVAGLRAAYKARSELLLAALNEHLPAGCTIAKPQGGFFIWIELPEGMDCLAVLKRAEELGVSFLPGTRFHSDGTGQRFIRLAFSMLEEEELREGARRLGAALRSL